MKIDAELYELISRIIDEKLKNITITKEDFTSLKNIVIELAEAQKLTEQRINELTDRVNTLTIRMDELTDRVNTLTIRMDELTDRVNTLTIRMDELTDRVNILTDRVNILTDRVNILTDRMNDLVGVQSRTEMAVKELAKQVGVLSDTIGYGLEDIARVVLPSYLDKHFGIKIKEIEKKFFVVEEKDQPPIEINLYAEGTKDGEKIILLGEAKSRIKYKDVNDFLYNVSFIQPQIKEKIIKCMFGYYIHPSAQEIAQLQDVILVASYYR